MTPAYSLIADSGSTKTTWAVTNAVQILSTFQTPGLNPYMLDDESLIAALRADLLPHIHGSIIGDIRFYGAGCRDEQIERMARALQTCVPGADVVVDSDLLGAAKALCGNTEGIACILGTGSNSCHYDGRRITANVAPLGFILGDEGSGASLGRRLVADVLKHQLPPAVCDRFHVAYPDTIAEIIAAVYRGPFPNRYLAAFAPFLKDNRDIPEVRALIAEEFTRFFRRNVAAYGRPDLPVHFVGSIALHFADILRESAAASGFTVGSIIGSPFERWQNLQ